MAAELKKGDPETCRKIGSLAKHMKGFINQPELSDVLIKFSGRKYSSHKLILAAWSTVLEKRLSVDGNLDVLDLNPDITLDAGRSQKDIHDGFLQFLTFLYSGQTKITDATVWTVLGLAQAYEIKPLQEKAEEHIIHEIGNHKLDKALDWIAEAEAKHLDVLKENCLAVLRSYFQFIPDAAWKKLRSDQLISIVESCDVVVDDEYSLFLKIEAWIKGREISDTEVLEFLLKVLPHVRFHYMTVRQLQELTKGRLGRLIDKNHRDCITEAIEFRALALEEATIPGEGFAGEKFSAPRLYLKFAYPGSRTAKEDVYTRGRCAEFNAYTDRRATVYVKTKGMYKLLDRDGWQVRIRAKQETKGKLWCVQVMLQPKQDHGGRSVSLVASIKIRQDVGDPIVLVYSGSVPTTKTRGEADGILLSTKYVLAVKPEYVHMRELVYVN